MLHTDYFTNCSKITVRDVFEWRFPCRIERKLRQMLLRQPDPGCPLLRSLYRLPAAQKAIVEAPGVRHPLKLRPATTDVEVVHYVFKKWAFNMTRLARWPEIEAFLKAQHERGRRPLIVDAGANIGITTVFFALAFPTALVIAIEPEQGNFDLLATNTNGLNVRCLQAALSSEIYRARLLDPGQGSWAFRIEKADDGDLPCVTINSIFAEVCDSDIFPFLVKINIEGGEKEVFERNTEWVEQTGIVVVELHDVILPKEGTARPFLNCVSKLDRDFVCSGFNVFSIDNNIFGQISAGLGTALSER